MKRKKSPNYLDFIRALPCLLCGDTTTVEAAHIRMGDRTAGKRPTGLGEKPDDDWAIPLCGLHHRLQHTFGEKIYWERQARKDPIRISLALQRNAGDIEAGEQIIEANR